MTKKRVDVMTRAERVEEALLAVMRSAHPAAVRELCFRIAQADAVAEGQSLLSQPMYRRLSRAASLVADEIAAHERQLAKTAPVVVTVKPRRKFNAK